MPAAIPAKVPKETVTLPVLSFAPRIPLTIEISGRGMLTTRYLVRALSARADSEGQTER
jgi:hypothetical protein